MRVTCPSCYALHELDALVSDAEARRGLARLAHLGGALESAVVSYLGCFRPAQRALSWSKFNRLLGELADAIEAGRIRAKGRDWVVTREQWTDALIYTVARRDAGGLRTPLKNHRYLFEVARALSDETEAQAERETEEARRAGRGPERTGDASVAERYEELLAEARRLGLDLDARGLLRPWSEMALAVREARAQEEASA